MKNNITALCERINSRLNHEMGGESINGFHEWAFMKSTSIIREECAKAVGEAAECAAKQPDKADVEKCTSHGADFKPTCYGCISAIAAMSNQPKEK